MKHHSRRPDGYEQRFDEYVDRELHPETAAHLKQLVWHSPVGSAEFAMGVILQMRLDHARRDAEVQASTVPATAWDDEMLQARIERTDVAQQEFSYRLADAEGEALPPSAAPRTLNWDGVAPQPGL